MTATTATTDVHAGFFADIIEHPADDTPRLIYADWLEEQGIECPTCKGKGETDWFDDADMRTDHKCIACHGGGVVRQPERAEFIRVQCELANPTLPPYFGPGEHPKLSALRRREGELFHAIKFLELKYDGGGPLDALRLTEEELRICELPLKGLLRRGFVSSVTCTLAAWMGVRCQVCNEESSPLIPLRYTSQGSLQCATCSGTGVTGRHGPRLVRCCPLECVRLSDREPMQLVAEENRQEWWFVLACEANRNRLEALPAALFALLDGYDTSTVTGKSYPTRQAALDALSAALLAWARKEPV